MRFQVVVSGPGGTLFRGPGQEFIGGVKQDHAPLQNKHAPEFMQRQRPRPGMAGDTWDLQDTLLECGARLQSQVSL